jgi:hypothetical protein
MIFKTDFDDALVFGRISQKTTRKSPRAMANPTVAKPQAR